MVETRLTAMRATQYGEPSDKEIDALHPPPSCPRCGAAVDDYDQLCPDCREIENQTDDP